MTYHARARRWGSDQQSLEGRRGDTERAVSESRLKPVLGTGRLKPVLRTAGRGFTLIEIMIVVGIIVILAGIGLAVGMGVKRQSADQVTKTTLKTLDLAMSGFLKEHPDPADANWFTALQATGQLPKSLKISGNNVLDGYQNAIHYIPANAQASAATPKNWTPKPMGMFWSYGVDGQPNTDDDVFSEGASAQ